MDCITVRFFHPRAMYYTFGLLHLLLHGEWAGHGHQALPNPNPPPVNHPMAKIEDFRSIRRKLWLSFSGLVIITRLIWPTRAGIGRAACLPTRILSRNVQRLFRRFVKQDQKEMTCVENELHWKSHWNPPDRRGRLWNYAAPSPSTPLPGKRNLRKVYLIGFRFRISCIAGQWESMALNIKHC